jgi:hypothetical protein
MGLPALAHGLGVVRGGLGRPISWGLPNLLVTFLKPYTPAKDHVLISPSYAIDIHKTMILNGIADLPLARFHPHTRQNGHISHYKISS